MKSNEPLYDIREAQRISLIAVGVDEIQGMIDAIDETYGRPDRWRYECIMNLAATAYICGLLQGKREERKRHKRT